MTYRVNFVLDIPDRHAAEFWLEEWQYRYQQTRDGAFKDSADEMELYINRRWPELGEVGA